MPEVSRFFGVSMAQTTSSAPLPAIYGDAEAVFGIGRWPCFAGDFHDVPGDGDGGAASRVYLAIAY